MKTYVDLDAEYIDDALRRIEHGVHRSIARRRYKIVAIAGAAALLVTSSTVAAALVWPGAKQGPYMICFGTDDPNSGQTSTGVGFDMRDPIGFCLDNYSYRAKPSDPEQTWRDKSRSDLMACKLADGVAGVFPNATRRCQAVDLVPWTPADAKRAQVLQTSYYREQHKKYGLPIPTIGTTPHQILNR